MSTDTAQQEIIEEFSFFDDWMDRYQYLIDLGKKLDDFPDEMKTDEFLMSGCQSKVWIDSEVHDGKLVIRASSDSAIVRGLIALVLRVYSGQLPADILSTEPEFIRAIGLSEHLSPTRSNGLLAMLDWIKKAALAVN